MQGVVRNELKVHIAALDVPAKEFNLFFNLFNHFSHEEGESPTCEASDPNPMSFVQPMRTWFDIEQAGSSPQPHGVRDKSLDHSTHRTAVIRTPVVILHYDPHAVCLWQ